jgi:catechol 2,3-dioxygenase-like lactoylglutathione lyase family enzyme
MAGGKTPVLPGIHHITAICSDPQRNVDFYAGLLGLRLVKQTVNFDDPGTYHLYYGDGTGSPGTIMTFFAWILPPMVSAKARQGTGQLTATPFSIPESSLDYWIGRFADADAAFEGPHRRFDEQVISLRDPDGLSLEVVTRGEGQATQSWAGGPVPAEHAIRGFGGATLSLAGYERTAALLTETMGLREVGAEGSRFRFAVGTGADAAMIDLLCRPEGEPGRMGIGAVHHLAWRARSDDEQLAWRGVVMNAGLDITPVLDRKYFRSVYYREPGGVLFEIATDHPGFTIDESPAELGTHLMLPEWLESRRARIEAKLPGLRPPTGARQPSSRPPPETLAGPPS